MTRFDDRYTDPDEARRAALEAEADRLLAEAAVERADDHSPYGPTNHAQNILDALVDGVRHAGGALCIDCGGKANRLTGEIAHGVFMCGPCARSYTARQLNERYAA